MRAKYLAYFTLTPPTPQVFLAMKLTWAANTAFTRDMQKDVYQEGKRFRKEYKPEEGHLSGSVG